MSNNRISRFDAPPEDTMESSQTRSEIIKMLKKRSLTDEERAHLIQLAHSSGLVSNPKNNKTREWDSVQTRSEGTSMKNPIGLLDLADWFANKTPKPLPDFNNNFENLKKRPQFKPHHEKYSKPRVRKCEDFQHNPHVAPYIPSINRTLMILIDQNRHTHHTDLGINCFKCHHLESFKSLTHDYQKKISHHLQSELTPEEKTSTLMNLLELWIYQLSEENLTIVESYSDSINEVNSAKEVIAHSRNAMIALQKEIDKGNSSIDALQYELSVRDAAITKLKREQELEKEKLKNSDESLKDSQTDVESLTELLIRLRDRGIWDISGLPLSNHTFQRIFKKDYFLQGARVIGQKEFFRKKREWMNEVDSLKSDIKTLQSIIAVKEKDLNRLKAIDGVSSKLNDRKV